MRLRPDQHLRLARDFRSVRETGRKLNTGAFAVWARARGEVEKPAGLTRLGVVASRASVGGAVERNRAKRRLREIFRRHQELVPSGTDVLLVARAAVNRLDYAEVEQMFVQTCRKLAPAQSK